MTFDTQPTLTTERLSLRPFLQKDAPDVQRLAGDRAVADTTARILHPYEDGMAEAWIATHPQHFSEREECTFAIVLKEASELIGAVSLTLNMEDSRGELGSWIGKEYWGHGYGTEAAREIIEFGFRVLSLHRIQAQHLTRNPVSGRVMQKLGMAHEGRLRQHTRKWDVFEDVDLYGLLKQTTCDSVTEVRRLATPAGATSSSACDQRTLSTPFRRTPWPQRHGK